MIEQRWFTPAQAAAYAGITVSAMRHWVRAGDLPAVKKRRQIFIDRYKLDAAMERCESTAPKK